jgi:hypothetical protein
VEVASHIYRDHPSGGARFCDEMRKTGLLAQIPRRVWREAWVVDSKAVGDGWRAVKYLAPYVFRVAISDGRIVSIDDGSDGVGRVTFTYRKSGSRRWRKMPVTAEEFLRRDHPSGGARQHVLPSGFQKVRHYGFAAATKRKDYEHVRWLATLALRLPFVLTAQPAADSPQPAVRCPSCGGALQFVAYLPPPKYFDTS